MVQAFLLQSSQNERAFSLTGKKKMSCKKEYNESTLYKVLFPSFF